MERTDVKVPPLAWSRTFPGVAAQAREARRFLAAILDGQAGGAASGAASGAAGGDAAGGDAIACLAELASNSIQHSRSGEPGGVFTVRARMRGGWLRVEVEDLGGDWRARPSDGGRHGHGLRIVGELAADWGVTGTVAGRTAWFEIDLAARRR